MAKNKTKAQVEDDFDDIDTDEGQSGGISDAQLKKAAKEFSSLKSKMDDARSPMGAFFKDFEEKGGHKAALKIAMKISDMENLKAQDFWRSLERYCEVLGIFDQHDLIDDLARPAKAESKTRLKEVNTDGASAH